MHHGVGLSFFFFALWGCFFCIVVFLFGCWFCLCGFFFVAFCGFFFVCFFVALCGFVARCGFFGILCCCFVLWGCFFCIVVFIFGCWFCLCGFFFVAFCGFFFVCFFVALCGFVARCGFFWRPLRLFCRPLCPYRALLVLKHPLLLLCPLGMLLLHCCLHFWLLVLPLRLLFCRLLRLLFCLLLRRPLRLCRPLRFFWRPLRLFLSSFVSLSGSSCTKASFVVALSFGDASSALLSSFLAAGFAFAASF